jgi:dephospho-CoA kinase
LNQAEIESLLAIQVPEKMSFSLADMIIENDGTVADLKEKIRAFHQDIMKQKTP